MMRPYFDLFVGLPIADEDGPTLIRAYALNPATAIAKAIADIEDVYERADPMERQALLAADPNSLRIKVNAGDDSGTCVLERDVNYRVHFHYSSERCVNLDLAAKQCQSLLGLANNAVSGFLKEYAKLLVKRRQEDEK